MGRRKSRSQEFNQRGARARRYLVQLLGGVCRFCQYDKYEALEFHHTDKKNKLFAFANKTICSNAWSKVLEEVQKCLLLCSNCHKEEEARLRNLAKVIASNPEFPKS